MKKRLKPISVAPQVKMEKKGPALGVWMEILLFYIGLVGYLFCNTTALDMGIHPAIVIAIATLSFGFTILLAWYKRVFFSVLGGAAGISLLAWPITFPFFRFLGRSLEVCYNYTIHLLASQPDYSDYKYNMTMDISDILKTPVVLQRYFYAALILLALIAAVFFALALFRRIPPIVAFLIPAAAMIPLFFYGIVPHPIAFSFFLAAIIGCYGQNLIRSTTKVKQPKKDKSEAKKSKQPRKKYSTAQRLEFASRSGAFGVVITAIMLIITIGTSMFIYSRPIVQMEKVRETIDMAAEDVLNLLFAKTYEKNLNVAGAMEEDEPLSMEMPRWRRLKVAKLKTITEYPVYLRFRTTMAITPEGWMAPDESYKEALASRVDKSFYEYTQFYEYLKLTAPSGDPAEAKLDKIDSEVEGYVNDEIVIKPQYQVSKLLGIPAGVAEATPEGKYTDLERIADTTLSHTKTPLNRTYTFSVVSPQLTSNEFLGKFQKTQDMYLKLRSKDADRDFYLNNEQAYSGLVKNYYTMLPTELRNLVQKQAQQLTMKYEDKIEKVQAIERYFQENFTYSTERHHLIREDGTDANAYEQINYFLYQNEEKRGYCTLFSSSMAVMLRSLGIPARVVTGYYAYPEIVDTDEYEVQLTDGNYHSWVEVYFDGAGWLNFEPTPGFGEFRNYYLLDQADQEKESEYADAETKVDYEEIDGEVSYSDVLPEPTPPKAEKPDDRPILDEANRWETLLIALGLILALFIALLLAAAVVHLLHLRKMKTLPYAEGIQTGYYIILRLMQMRGFKFFEGELLESFAQRVDNLELSPLPMKQIVPLLQKGLYGAEEITLEERDAVANFVLAMDKRFIFRVDPFRAIWYSLILSRKPRHKSMIWNFE